MKLFWGVFTQTSELFQTWRHTHACPFKGSEGEEEEEEEECCCCSDEEQEEKDEERMENVSLWESLQSESGHSSRNVKYQCYCFILPTTNKQRLSNNPRLRRY